MSWKGLKKAVERLPQRVMSRAGYSEETVDQEMYVLEARFNELESCTEKLYHDARKYRDTTLSLLSHQAAFGEILCDVYGANSSGSSDTSPDKNSLSEVKPTESTSAHVSSQAAHAAEQFARVMSETRDALMPELDAIDRFIIEPTNDLISLIKAVKKTLVKREHKRLDYDRHRDALQKLKANPNRDLNDEKKLFKVEQQVEQATKDYNSVNDVLKEQLPVFLQLRIAFIDPCFLSFYQLQKKMFRLLLEKLEPLLGSGYFNVDAGILSNYERRKEKLQSVIETLESLRYRKPVAAPSVPNVADIEGTPSAAASELHDIDQPPSYDSAPGSSASSPKAVHWSQTAMAPSSASVAVGVGPGAEKKPFGGGFTIPSSSAGARPAPPKPPSSTKPVDSHPTYVVALYDYNAQAETDLSFKRDDKIEVIRRTADINDWWTGRLGGKVGEFPANYVAEI